MTSFAGAVILKDLNKTVLFKNRDLDSAGHKDDIFYDIDCFGVRGIDMSTAHHSGLSIGVNRYGLAVANTHVRATSDPSYDILTEQILMFARDAEDGLAMTVDHLKKGRQYQWGNLILADHDSMLVIEIAGNEHSIEWSERKVLRTGHHIMLDTEDQIKVGATTDGPGTYYDDSVARVERGYDLLRNVNDMNSIFAMLKDHDPVQGQASICKHSTDTVSQTTATSYVIEIDHQRDTDRPRVVFNVAKGAPCTTPFTSIPLVFPADEEIMRRAQEMYFK
ncbi:MAG: carcinine hydrolase/isopenicillin-N N-acyltransferase family protein [Candidatus Thorarchaeota archaeon]